MAQTNTISNLDNISSLAYNDLFATDNQNSLDIFGAPVTENVSALQIYQYMLRAGGSQTTLDDCVVCATGNIAGTYNNGTAGVGATLTITATGALVIDGRTMAVNERVLLPFQTSGLENGIYTVTNAGAVGVNPIISRAADFDTASDMVLGACVSVLGGSTLFGTTFEMYTASTITVGTTSILFRQPNAVLVGSTNAMSVSGNGNLIWNVSTLSNLTVPAGTKTLVASGDNVTFGTITSDSHTFNTGTGIKTGTSSGNTYLLTAYDVDNAVNRTFITATAGNTPTVDISAPSGGVLTMSNITGISSGTPGTGIIGELLSSSLAAGSAVSLSNDVNTDITSIAYTAGNWLVTANPKLVYSAITNTVNLIFVGTASGDNQTGITAFNANHIEHPATGASGTAGGTISYIFNTSSSGTLYLKMKCTFSAGTATAYGGLQMVRIS